MHVLLLAALKMSSKLKAFLIGAAALAATCLLVLGTIHFMKSGDNADVGTPSNSTTQNTNKHVPDESESDDGVIDLYVEDTSLPDDKSQEGFQRLPDDDNQYVEGTPLVDRIKEKLIKFFGLKDSDLDNSSDTPQSGLASRGGNVVWINGSPYVQDTPPQDDELQEGFQRLPDDGNSYVEDTPPQDDGLQEGFQRLPDDDNSYVEDTPQSEEVIALRFDRQETSRWIGTRWSETEKIIQSLKGEREPTEWSTHEEALIEAFTDKEIQEIVLIHPDGTSAEFHRTNPEFTITFQPTTDVDMKDRLSKIEEAISQWSKGKQATAE